MKTALALETVSAELGGLLRVISYFLKDYKTRTRASVSNIIPFPEGITCFRSPPRSRHGRPTAHHFSLSGGLRRKE